MLKFILTMTLITFNSFAFSQNVFKSFKKLSFPEKLWVITHPFVAKSCWSKTQQARRTSENFRSSLLLDTFNNGGKLDAFRHAYWMALIVQKHSLRKGISLGKAHEKGNQKLYRRGMTEEGELPDSTSKEMDLWNNHKGAILGLTHRQVSEDRLQQVVIEAIRQGEMRIIMRNREGRYLDSEGKVIPEVQLRKWNNNKVLVPSNFIF